MELTRIRKLLLCALSRNDLGGVKSAFFSLSEETQKDPTTQYLMYRASIRSGDHELATECLEAVARASVRVELLYACVADSQRVGDRLVTLAAMKKLADVYDHGHPGPVHLPALLRCTIMLQHGLLNGDKKVVEDPVVTDLCRVFEAGRLNMAPYISTLVFLVTNSGLVVSAVRKGPKDADGNKLFVVKELEWFCQNAYNLGVKHAGNWDLRSTVCILSVCVQLIGEFPDDIAAATAGDLSLRSIFCHFLISSALVSLARAQDNREAQLQDYLVMRRHIAAADGEIQQRLQCGNLDEVSVRDLLTKLAQLLAFDFEASAALKDYQGLREIIEKASQCEDLESFKAMADCALRSQLPAEGSPPFFELWCTNSLTGLFLMQSSSASCARSSTKYRPWKIRIASNFRNTRVVCFRSRYRSKKNLETCCSMRLMPWFARHMG